MQEVPKTPEYESVSMPSNRVPASSPEESGDDRPSPSPNRLNSHIYEAPDQGLAGRPATVGSPPAMLPGGGVAKVEESIYGQLPNDYRMMTGETMPLDDDGRNLCKVCGRPALKNKHGNCKMCYQALYQDANKLSKSKKAIVLTGDDEFDLRNFQEAVKSLRNGCRNDHKCPPSSYRFDLDPRKKCMRCHTLACIREFPGLALRVQKVTVGNMERKKEAHTNKRSRPHDYAALHENTPSFPPPQFESGSGAGIAAQPHHVNLNGLKGGGLEVDGLDHIHSLTGTNGMSFSSVGGLFAGSTAAVNMFNYQATDTKNGVTGSSRLSNPNSPHLENSPYNHQQQMQAYGMEVPELGMQQLDFMTGPNTGYSSFPSRSAMNFSGPYNKGLVTTTFDHSGPGDGVPMSLYTPSDMIFGGQMGGNSLALVTSASQLDTLDIDGASNLNELAV